MSPSGPTSAGGSADRFLCWPRVRSRIRSKRLVGEQLILQGKSDAEIGKAIGIAMETVAMWRQRLGVSPPRPQPRRFRGEALLRAGRSDQEIAFLLKISPATVGCWRRGLGLPARPAPEPTVAPAWRNAAQATKKTPPRQPARDDPQGPPPRARALIRAGATDRQVASAFGVRPGRACLWRLQVLKDRDR